MPDDEIADVVRIHPELDLDDEDAPLRTVPRGPFCGHYQIRLDQEAHRAYCQKCDREVDPFAYLLMLAGQWERYITHRKGAAKKAEAAQARLDETLRLERNARSRVRRLGGARDLPAVPWGEGGGR